MIKTSTYMDIVPSSDKKCCQNCRSFRKFGVHSGYCINKKTEKLDNQKCKKFELQTEIREDL